MRKLWTVALLISSLSIQAQSLEDVIYKKDGSVLRGTLVEQDFENGRYKIQLQGGSLFSVNKDDIEKITKEEPISSLNTSTGSVNVNIDNSPTINQNPSISQSPTMYIPLNSRAEKAATKSVFYMVPWVSHIQMMTTKTVSPIAALILLTRQMPLSTSRFIPR